MVKQDNDKSWESLHTDTNKDQYVTHKQLEQFGEQLFMNIIKAIHNNKKINIEEDINDDRAPITSKELIEETPIVIDFKYLEDKYECSVLGPLYIYNKPEDIPSEMIEISFKNYDQVLLCVDFDDSIGVNGSYLVTFMKIQPILGPFIYSFEDVLADKGQKITDHVEKLVKCLSELDVSLFNHYLNSNSTNI